ncbi:hypothetical protein Taro_028537 [Colocasia esculenta]|uniref:Uncharacterized protein n=1 Tax=Colocasia esculenta TaxID=4460 RepID=A0A843VGQ5_COLES|nr:hypothetical protein [Colocasia esculenta]
MGVDDGVFVPPSDITHHGDYIDDRNEVFVPLFDIYRIVKFTFALTTGCLCLRRAFTNVSVDDRVFVLLSDNIASTCVVSLTTEDLNEDAGSHVTTCGDFTRTRRRKARTQRTEHQRQPETSSPALADQSSELRRPNRPGEPPLTSLPFSGFLGHCRPFSGFLGHPGRFMALWDIPAVFWPSRTSRLFFGFMGHSGRLLALQDIPAIW